MKIEQPLINRFILYFFRGLLLIVPLGATLYVISVVLQKIDSVASFGIPGLGMFIVIVSITLLGYIGTNLLVKSAFGFTEELIKKIPFIRVLYSSLKDFTSAFVSNKKKFTKPVLVLMDKNTQVYRIGFITRESLNTFNLPEHIAVYLPNSYDLSGMLLMVPRLSITLLDFTSTDIIKFNFSAGLTPLNKEEEEEEEEEEESKEITDEPSIV